MKRWIAMLCICALLASGTVVLANGFFPDLPQSHWAYTSVEKMRNDGRVNGFPDGEFKPDELVTRWQFAKMAGGDPDVMTEPERPATRDEAALYLWERAGKPNGVAPSVVAKGSKNPEAIYWAYSTGVMQGDDGLNLRLDSTLTRAEAATLIVRAEQELVANVAFKDTVQDVILKRVWDAMQTGLTYDKNQTVSNGVIANMALRIMAGEPEPTYYTLQNEPAFEGEYVKDVALVSQDCWGKAVTADFVEASVTVEDALAALTLYTMKQATSGISMNQNAKYDDVTLTSTMGQMALRFANYNGIYLIAENKIEATRTATMQDVACILLQLDDILGLNRTYGTQGNSRLHKAEYPWPANAADYAYIMEDMPTAHYETPLKDGFKPVDDYAFAQIYAAPLADFLVQISATVPQDVKVRWTYYPSLVVQDAQQHAVIRAKLEILNNPKNLSLNQILKSNQFTETYHGGTFFVDIATGTVVGDVVINAKQYVALRAFAGKE